MPLHVSAELQRTPVILRRDTPTGPEYRLAVLQQMNAAMHDEHMKLCYDLRTFNEERERAEAERSKAAAAGVAPPESAVSLKVIDPTQSVYDSVQRSLWMETNASPSIEVVALVAAGKAEDPDKGDARCLAFFDASVQLGGRGVSQRNVTMDELRQYPWGVIAAFSAVLRGWDQKDEGTDRP